MTDLWLPVFNFACRDVVYGCSQLLDSQVEAWRAACLHWSSLSRPLLRCENLILSPLHLALPGCATLLSSVSVPTLRLFFILYLSLFPLSLFLDCRLLLLQALDFPNALPQWVVHKRESAVMTVNAARSKRSQTQNYAAVVSGMGYCIK